MRACVRACVRACPSAAPLQPSPAKQEAYTVHAVRLVQQSLEGIVKHRSVRVLCDLGAILLLDLVRREIDTLTHTTP